MNSRKMTPSKLFKKQGFALVLVLLLIILVTTIAVLFLTAAGQERKGVDLYAKGSLVDHFKGLAVNRVMGQINAATKEGTASAPVAWASQPGMLRTYDATGDAKNIYKLYSWDTAASVPASGFDPSDASEAIPAGWKNSPGLFTDLNQPVNAVYPIVDPAAAGKVKGFSVDESAPAVSGSGSDAPMPVRWLYVLEDGRMVAPSTEGGSSITVDGAGPDNRIVGRVAFWTDDETSKVNINTASEGAFWDVPRGATRDEMQFAANPPVKFEFQRTPGHPALTSLSAVFPELMTSKRWEDTDTYRAELTSLYNLTPRIQGGGSEGGTLPISSYETDYPLAPPLPTLPTKITLDSDRLYASPDEFWFKAPDPAAPIAGRTGRTANTALSGLGVSELQKRLFFLTASSRAPETTLFETPRVSLWPITWPYPSSYFKTRESAPTAVSPTSGIDQNPWMTSEEKLLAFCATLNTASGSPLRYYFQRQNPDSPTHDWSAIPRNQEMVGYLRRSFGRNIPAFGGNLATHWGATNADWIALNTFDFSRSMINQVTRAGTAAKAVVAGSNDVGYSYTGLTAREIWIDGKKRKVYVEPNAYTVSPLRVALEGNTYTTQGAYPKLSQASVVFYATDRRLPVPPTPIPSTPNPPVRATPENDYYNPFNWQNLINPGPGYGGSPDYPVGSQTTQMRAVVLFDFAGVGQGDDRSTPIFWIKLRGDSFSVNGASIGLPASGGRAVQWTGIMKNMPGAIPSIFYPLYQRDSSNPKIFDNGTSGVTRWAFISDPVAMTPTDVEFSFAGSETTVEIYAPYSADVDTDPTGDPGQLISSQTVNFGQWSGSLPIPVAPRWSARDGDTATATHRPLASTQNFKTSETRALNWAYTEIVPYIANPQNPVTADLRDSLSSAGKRSMVYAYVDENGTLVSPNFENRVKALGNSRTGALPKGPFLAEHTGSDIFGAAVDAPFIEALPLITPYDTVISMVLDASAPDGGDPRLASGGTFRRIDQVLTASQPDTVFRTVPEKPGLTEPAYPRATAGAQWHALGSLSGRPMGTGYRQNVLTFDSNPMAQTGRTGFAVGNLGKTSSSIEEIVGGIFNMTAQVDPTWDWTMMPGNRMDGGMLARPDQDYQTLFVDFSDSTVLFTPYFMRYGGYSGGGENYFSPNRQIPSPVILGTLPSSLTEGWRTLAFSPNPAAGSSHPGLASPPDHLLLDLFWMPVAEPYPISDQFSTAGKVNLNYAIMPFSYIERKTGLYAVLEPVWMSALPDSAAKIYKAHAQVRDEISQSRFPIDVEKTLADFDSKFAAGDIFRSASQICEMFLVPEGETLASTKSSFWNSRRLTADNSREQPYDHIYSRVTTKSNTFTVHWRVQALSKPPSTNAAVWEEGRDKIAGELRGSTLIERYLDPNAANIPDYATDSAAEPLGNFYKWRVLSENFFQP